MGDPISTENEKSIYKKVIHLVPATLSDVLPLDAAVGNEGMHTCNENRNTINGTTTTSTVTTEHHDDVGEENHHRHQSLNLMMISCEDSYPYGPSSNTAVSVQWEN